MKQTYQVTSAKETQDIGEMLAAYLKKGDIVCLYGELGSGKTTFSKGVIRALGVSEHVTSPTFTLVHEYRGRLPVYHFDVYRMIDSEEMMELGYEEYFFGDGVCLIEWAELIEELLPETVIRVHLNYTKEEEERVITIEYFSN